MGDLLNEQPLSEKSRKRLVAIARKNVRENGVANVMLGLATMGSVDAVKHYVKPAGSVVDGIGVDSYKALIEGVARQMIADAKRG